MRRRFFRFVAGLAIGHPRAVVAAALVLAAASGAYAAATLTLNANLDELVSERLDYHRRYIEFLKEFGDEEYLYVVVDASDDLPRAKRFLDALGARLKGHPDLKQVIWRIENPALERNFLLYLTPEQLGVLAKMTSQGPFSAKSLSSWDGFAPMFGALASRIAGPVSPADEAELSTGFTFIDGLIDDMAAAIEGGRPYSSRLQELFFGDGETFDPDGFIKNGGLLFMLIMPSKDYSTAAVIERPLAEVRAAVDGAKAEFPGITAGLTGRPVLAADEIETSNRDMAIATAMALALVAAILIVSFRGLKRPLCAVASLAIGISWTFGFAAFAVGTLNILSIVFALLLIGASIEYSIYTIARYEEELSRSGDAAAAIRATLATTGMANVTSGLTTAAAFLTLTWTDFTGLAELGAIAAVGIVLCLAAMLVVLPAMLFLSDRRLARAGLMRVRSFDLPAMRRLYARPTLLFGAAVAIIAMLLPSARRVGFDNNLLKLQARGIESVEYEHLVIEKSSETTWFARAVADSAEASRALAERLAALPSVRRVDDVSRIVPDDQEAKIARVKAMAGAFEGIEFAEPSLRVNAMLLMYELGRLASNLERLEAQAFTSGRADAVEELGRFAAKVRGLVSLIDGADAEDLAKLGLMQRDFFTDLAKHIGILASGMNPTRIELSDLPADMVGRFVSPKGRYALFIYPKEDIWDPAALERFVSEIRGVDPTVIGTPIEVHESAGLMRRTFARSALLAIAVICLLVFLDFKSAGAAVVAVIPLLAGMAILAGAMGLLGIDLNMANFFAIPILIGTGVDFGVQVVHRLRQERSFAAMGTSTGRALVMTALANGAGFGAMMIAHHRGIASLGAILALGCLCCLSSAVAIAPPVAKWLRWGGSRGRAD